MTKKEAQELLQDCGKRVEALKDGTEGILELLGIIADLKKVKEYLEEEEKKRA